MTEGIITWLKENAGELVREFGEGSHLEFPIALQVPKNNLHGDYATAVAMQIGKYFRIPPLEVADKIARKLKNSLDSSVEKIEVAPPGFINIFLKKESIHPILKKVIEEGESFGRSKLFQGKRVNIEFVSANPTGPLNVVSARAAAVGDTLARIFEANGYTVVAREYYVNDAGRQADLFSRSVEARMLELLGRDFKVPEDGYRGEYVKDLAAQILKEKESEILNLPENQRLELLRQISVELMVERQKKDLEEFGVKFDKWFFESDLHTQGSVKTKIDELLKSGFAYEKDGALWFKSGLFGDDKDRVLVRNTGEPTYFSSEIAYQSTKFERGFDTIINLWGPDHHGYIPRTKGAMEALGYNKDALVFLIVQQVNVTSATKVIKMSKRQGEFVTLEELLKEVARDAARYFFLTRSPSSHLDFDIELAKRQTLENPVYYVQYAHARASSILRYGRAQGLELEDEATLVPELLTLPEEITLLKCMLEFPTLLKETAVGLAPHRLTSFAQSFSSHFHDYYTKVRVIGKERDLSLSRLWLVLGVRVVLENLLKLLGVSAPERM